MRNVPFNLKFILKVTQSNCTLFNRCQIALSANGVQRVISVRGKSTVSNCQSNSAIIFRTVIQLNLVTTHFNSSVLVLHNQMGKLLHTKRTENAGSFRRSVSCFSFQQFCVSLTDGQKPFASSSVVDNTDAHWTQEHSL